MTHCPLCQSKLLLLFETNWHCPCVSLRIFANDNNLAGYQTSGFMFQINKNSGQPSVQLIINDMIIFSDLTWQTLIVQRLSHERKEGPMINLPFIFDILDKLKDPSKFANLILNMIVFS